AKRDGVVAYLQSCLGKHWARKRTNFQNGATDTKFTLGSDEPVPHIRESIYTDGRGNILRIEVDVPSSLIRQGQRKQFPSSRPPHRRRPRRNRPTRPEPIAKT
ncbi:MAG TPA: hypothetical protein VK984_06120, partial [Methyloceanibacter sp.]|nr:hypothetical protein [Methyloceanibacter sp.]